jgi:adenylate cyclase
MKTITASRVPAGPALQRERLALYLKIIVAGAALGAVYGLVISHDGSMLAGLAIGGVNGLLVAAGIGGIELFALRCAPRLRRRLLRLPFVVAVAVKTLVYAPIVMAVPAMHLLGVMLPQVMHQSPVDVHTELITVGFSAAASLVFVIVLQAAGLVGGRTLADLMLGRYRRPRLERRFFLFIDVVGSTPIAERLGPLESHRMLGLVFSAVAEPIAETRGEIYQYVGDQIVVSWTEAQGACSARPVRCFLQMQEALAGMAAQFRERFGTVPELRGALHVGEVVAGEVGEQRRAIVFHGDVLNATARLEQATRELGRRFIVSADALKALGPVAEVDVHDLGLLALRGRKAPMHAWAVAPSAAPA